MCLALLCGVLWDNWIPTAFEFKSTRPENPCQAEQAVQYCTRTRVTGTQRFQEASSIHLCLCASDLSRGGGLSWRHALKQDLAGHGTTDRSRYQLVFQTVSVSIRMTVNVTNATYVCLPDSYPYDSRQGSQICRVPLEHMRVHYVLCAYKL